MLVDGWELSECCCVEDDALLPFVVPLEGKKRSKFRGPREGVGGALLVKSFILFIVYTGQLRL